MHKPQMRRYFAPIAVTGGLVMAFAGCQVAPPVQTGANGGQVSAGVNGQAPGAQAPGATGGQAGATTPDRPEMNATVTGTVVDANGAPVAGVRVATFHNVETVTDAAGKFSMAVAANERTMIDLSHDNFLPRQLLTAVEAGETAELYTVLKPLDATVTKVSASAGATLSSSDGNAQLIIPPGALAGDTDVRVNWLDPMPSDKFPVAYGQLPGPLLTQEKDGPALNISPLGFSQLDFMGAGLAPGAQATLRMKVTPETLAFAQATGQKIDFANPASLQQPCYEYDREISAWVNPATSKLEKDANGDVWFVYTVHGRETPKNFQLLQTVSQGNFKSGERIVRDRRERTVTTGYSIVIGGGGRATFSTMAELNNYCRRNFCDDSSLKRLTKTEVYYVERVEDIMGKNVSGKVIERSANGNFNGKGISGAVVRHSSDFFNGTAKSTNGGGGFTVPISHKLNANNIRINGASWRGANSSDRDWTMAINTDSQLHFNVHGGPLNLAASNSNLRGGSRDGNVKETVSRDSRVTLTAPAGAYLFHQGKRVASVEGTAPVDGQLNFGAVHVLQDTVGRVLEASLNSALNNKPLSGAAVSHAADFHGKGSTSTNGNGEFSVTAHNKKPVTVTGSTWNGASSSGGGYQMTIKTDGSVKANVVGGAAPYSAANSNLKSGQWEGAVNAPASRDSRVTLSAPSGGFLFAGTRQGSIVKSVPVVGVADFGTVKVGRDWAGQVVEKVTGTDNANMTTLASNGAGLAGVTVTGFTDITNNATNTTTDGNGNFGFALYYSAQAPTVNANFKGFVNRDGASPYRIELPTDSTYSVTLTGLGSQNEELTVTYTVDGVEHSKVVRADANNQIHFNFARDTRDNQLVFKIKQILGTTVVSTGAMPTGTLTPNGSGEGVAKMAFRSEGAK